MSLLNIVEKRISHARNTAQEFDRMEMSDSAEMWWLVVGVLEGILLESGTVHCGICNSYCTGDSTDGCDSYNSHDSSAH